MKLIVGLGNHGKKYDHTRHNAGWDVVSALAKDLKATFSKKTEFQSEIAEGRIGEEKILLVHPLTYMNLSGQAVASLKQYFTCETRDILVVQDEMDFPVGTMVFTAKNGPAGHNGIISIQESLGTKEISRLRIGIGRPTDEQARESFVLEKFSTNEQKIFKDVCIKSVEAIKDWVSQGIDKTMNSWNRV